MSNEMRIKSLIMQCEGKLCSDLPTNITIGKPLRKDGIRIGEIVSAEVKGDYVEAVCELNEQGRKIYNELQQPQLVTFDIKMEEHK